MHRYWIWLAGRPGLGSRGRQALLRHFPNPEAIYRAAPEALQTIPELTPEGLKALADKSLDRAEAICRDCSQKQIRILTLSDGAYPKRLKQISDPPLVLYAKGELPELDSLPAIGVVGTRQCSAYGLSAACAMGYQIGRCGGIVVSGLAAGIDRAAMEGCLKARQPVVGVPGCGVDVVCPTGNRELYAAVESYGCILSQYPPGTPPRKGHFPQRNRIISGLSCGVLVVEAPEISGALITARNALEQGRDVFAVPGNIDNPCCAGSNGLLRQGAIPAACGWDILGEYESRFPGRVRRDDSRPEIPEKTGKIPAIPGNIRVPAEKPWKKGIDKDGVPPYSGLGAAASLSPEQRAVLEALKDGPRLVDDIIAGSGKPAGAVLAMLTLLEVKGLIRTLPGRRICLRGD